MTDPGTADVVAALRRVVRGDVDAGTRRRAEYSTDASNYRVVPQVVVQPLDTDDVLAVLDVARTTGTPLTCRGGGTSVAGNAVGPGIVLDLSRHLHRVLEVDPEAGTARVEPGVVLAALQRRVAPHGLRFGPDPSTHARATLGGMIGNNACGPHAVAHGRTADNVAALTVADGRGRVLDTRTPDAVPGLAELVDRNLATVRTSFGRFGRQVSGYSLEHLLPERGRDLSRALVGSEGTLAVVLDATVRLVRRVPATALAVLGYPDMPAAADAVPALLRHRPEAVEGLDSRLVDVVRRHRGAATVPALPRGAGWLMVETAGATEAEAVAGARAVAAAGAPLDSLVVPAGPVATALWRIREDGAGLAGRTPGGRPAWPGWEDAAVPPDRLGRYLREFDELAAAAGLTGIPYGHFGDGCVHVRLDLPLHDPARAAGDLTGFVRAAAELVVRHGGSLSGEHGDGRARGDLLPLMYPPAAIELFGAVKALFDPADVLNPGVLVRPDPVGAALRRPAARPTVPVGGWALREDGGDLTTAVHRCVGVGKCRADSTAAGGFMCPSYLATRDERDSTRGRARVLQELTNGTLVRDWTGPEVQESLELCLSCKACATDCPAGVDMARYKSEALYRRYRGRRRPASHYSLGALPRWLAVLDRLPRGTAAVANRALSGARTGALLRRAAGIDPRRALPALPARSFRRRGGGRRDAAAGGPAPLGPALLWVDTFSGGLDPDAAAAAVTVLTRAGHRVESPARAACCGLTWITTGQLDTARRRLRGLLDVLGPAVADGIPVVGLEPSCVAAVRSDLPELLPDDPRSAAVAGAVRTLAELLAGAPSAAGWRPPDLSGLRLVVQPHCHHHSVLGWDADRALLARTGAEVEELAGCCGLAGNWGMERGHYETSVAVARTALLPALERRSGSTGPGGGTVVLADGFSCRTQIDQLAGVPALTLAQLLAAPPGPPGPPGPAGPAG
ncbi:FAD-binding and (Fe-S)-binding domain-containing protein [Nakamurella endophytica]|uniref:FAD-binding and (Fe-S)-binding domain-containing protein n=1 Tax=Nakamurella endophytica TaxID=1748367 RepID=UPI001E3D6B9C|nr:FAD-binding and (Fe-S)-binding domain-containing protein [Nakamurella endophytica]